MARKSDPAIKPSEGADSPRKKRAAAKDDAGIGRRSELQDHERAIGRPITYASDKHPMQAAPDHGPHK